MLYKIWFIKTFSKFWVPLFTYSWAHIGEPNWIVMELWFIWRLSCLKSTTHALRFLPHYLKDTYEVDLRFYWPVTFCNHFWYFPASPNKLWNCYQETSIFLLVLVLTKSMYFLFLLGMMGRRSLFTSTANKLPFLPIPAVSQSISEASVMLCLCVGKRIIFRKFQFLSQYSTLSESSSGQYGSQQQSCDSVWPVTMVLSHLCYAYCRRVRHSTQCGSVLFKEGGSEEEKGMDKYEAYFLW